jgi:hypothetical protein
MRQKIQPGDPTLDLQKAFTTVTFMRNFGMTWVFEWQKVTYDRSTQ